MNLVMNLVMNSYYKDIYIRNVTTYNAIKLKKKNIEIRLYTPFYQDIRKYDIISLIYKKNRLNVYITDILLFSNINEIIEDSYIFSNIFPYYSIKESKQLFNEYYNEKKQKKYNIVCFCFELVN